jgi:hypothetical protein
VTLTADVRSLNLSGESTIEGTFQDAFDLKLGLVPSPEMQNKLIFSRDMIYPPWLARSL